LGHDDLHWIVSPNQPNPTISWYQSWYSCKSYENKFNDATNRLSHNLFSNCSISFSENAPTSVKTPNNSSPLIIGLTCRTVLNDGANSKSFTTVLLLDVQIINKRHFCKQNVWNETTTHAHHSLVAFSTTPAMLARQDWNNVNRSVHNLQITTMINKTR
jgi:hypothetical protein